MGLSLVAAPVANLATPATSSSPDGLIAVGPPANPSLAQLIFLEAFAGLLGAPAELPGAGGLASTELSEAVDSDELEEDSADPPAGPFAWTPPVAVPEPPPWIAAPLAFTAIYSFTLPSFENSGEMSGSIPGESLYGEGSSVDTESLGLPTATIGGGEGLSETGTPAEAESGEEAFDLRPSEVIAPAVAPTAPGPDKTVDTALAESSRRTLMRHLPSRDTGIPSQTSSAEPLAPFESSESRKPVVMEGTISESQRDSPSAAKPDAIVRPGPDIPVAPSNAIPSNAATLDPSSSTEFTLPAETGANAPAGRSESNPSAAPPAAAVPGEGEGNGAAPKAEKTLPGVTGSAGVEAQPAIPGLSEPSISSAPPRGTEPVSRPASIEAPAEIRPLPRSNPPPKIAVRLEPPPGAEGPRADEIQRVRPVDVVFEQRGPTLNFSVQTDDPQLAAELRRSIGDLAARLEREGFEARLRPAEEGVSRPFSLDSVAGESARGDSDHEGRRAFSGQDPDQRQGSDGSGRRQSGQREQKQDDPPLPAFIPSFTQSMQTIFEEKQ
jgi:hypothetical protein